MGAEEPPSAWRLARRRGGGLPATFRSLKLLRALNVAAMGLSLAAITGSVFAHLFGQSVRFGALGVIVGVPTLIFGMLWAVLLRLRGTVRRTKVRWGWVASVPLAVANGAVAGGLLIACLQAEVGSFALTDVLSSLMIGGAVGATFGAIFWLPGLVATLTFFGLPVSWSQKLAKTGLAGEERGERIIGIASVVLALLGLAATSAGEMVATTGTPLLEYTGYVLLYIFAIGGITTGAFATTLAQIREARRRRFVADVEDGRVSGYRIDEAPEGKVLVRITSAVGGYRVADIEQEVYALDDEGKAKAEMVVSVPR